MKAYAEGKMAENSDPDRKEYGLNSNNCGTFARDVVAQDGDVDNPSIWNPTPINIVDEYIEEGNAEVKYDPKKNITTVGTGDESDAKKSGGKKSTFTPSPLPKMPGVGNYIGSAGSADDYYRNLRNKDKKE